MDQSIFHFINQQWTSPALDLFMAGLSDSAIWEPLFIAIGVSALLFGGFRARAFVICLALSLVIASQVTGLLKSAVDRHRPKHVENVRMVQLQRTRPAFVTLFKKPTIRFSDSSDRNEQRFPNRAIAEGGHEQVERRTGPLLINKMKDGLIHAMKVKQPLSFNR